MVDEDYLDDLEAVLRSRGHTFLLEPEPKFKKPEPELP